MKRYLEVLLILLITVFKCIWQWYCREYFPIKKFNRGMGMKKQNSESGSITVSYTHLDVYKRQVAAVLADRAPAGIGRDFVRHGAGISGVLEHD